MNKRGDINGFGVLLFVGALAVFTFYSMFVYIPALQKDMSNSGAVLNALWWGVGCGIVGTIGAFLAKG
jgi:hypothetical protein